MEAGDVALASLIQADGESKLRPVLLLCRLPGFGDWLTCGISTQTRQMVDGFDELLVPADEDYTTSGVRSESLAHCPGGRLPAPWAKLRRSVCIVCNKT